MSWNSGMWLRNCGMSILRVGCMAPLSWRVAGRLAPA
jgi:hypothetical protein